MSKRRGMSKAARARKSSATGWGVALCFLAFFAWFGFAVGNDGPDDAAWSPLMLLIPGLAVLAYGLSKDLRAARFNRDDSERVDRVHAALDQLCRVDPSAAYERAGGISHSPARTSGPGDPAFRLDDRGRRHGLASAPTRLLRPVLHDDGWARVRGGGADLDLGSPEGGSNVALKISATTRDNLMGDALIAVVEIPDAQGGFDTLRVLGVSQTAVRSWITDLTTRAAAELGGSTTHAGQAVAAWGTRLANTFGVTEVSYAADQLLAIAERGVEDRPMLGVEGIPVGRNAVLATTVSVGEHRVVPLFPHRLPQMLGAALSSAVGQVVAPPTPPALAS